MKESAIVRAIIKAVKAKYPNAFLFKISDRFRRGIPDLLIQFEGDTYLESVGFRLRHGKTLYVETKTQTGVVSKIQTATMEEIERGGGRTIVSRDPATVLAKLELMGAISG